MSPNDIAARRQDSLQRQEAVWSLTHPGPPVVEDAPAPSFAFLRQAAPEDARLAGVRQCLYRASWTGIRPCGCAFRCWAGFGPGERLGGRETTEADCLDCIPRNLRRHGLLGEAASP